MQSGWRHLRDADRENILRGVAAGKVRGGPYHAEIDPIDACNADCFFCNSSSFRRGSVLPWPRLEKLMDEFVGGGLRSVRLAGGGEPTLYPEFGSLCARLARDGIVLDNLTTNGMRLDEGRIGAVLPLGPTNFHVSLNYATREQYARFMGVPPARFDDVIKHLRLLDQMLTSAGKRDSSQVHIQFFVHRSTVGDLERALDLSKELPVDSVTLRSVHKIGDAEQLGEAEREQVTRLLPVLAEKSRGHVWLMFDLGVDGLGPACEAVTQELHREHLATQEPRNHWIEYCFMPWYSMTVRGTGEVYPCCYLMPDPAVSPYGNLMEQSVQNVWTGPAFSRLRTEMREVIVRRRNVSSIASSFQCVQPVCRVHGLCPFNGGLADTAFYRASNARIRIQPATLFWRLARKLGF